MVGTDGEGEGDDDDDDDAGKEGAQERGMRVRAIRRVMFCAERCWSKRAGKVVWVDDDMLERFGRSWVGGWSFVDHLERVARR